MGATIHPDPEALLGRKATAEMLTEAGYRVTESTLATKASRGGGPPFQKFGRYVSYRWRNSIAWAESCLSPPRNSTSEADVHRTK
jgi:hypothetical protein